MRRRTSLMYAGLHPRTLRAYRLALDRFLKFANKHRLPLRNARSLDKQLAEFIDLLYQEGEPISYAGHLLSAIKRFHPQLRLSLPRSSQYFRNWQRCYVPSRALPASWDLVEGLMGLAFHNGQRSFGLLLALGFNCLLRTSEMLSLTHKHVVFHPRRNGLSVVIPGSKTSQGNPQVLLVTDRQLVQLAKDIICPTSDALLWTTGAHQFRATFDDFLVQLRFPSGTYTPYCLRRGGLRGTFSRHCRRNSDARPLVLQQDGPSVHR